MAEGYESTIYDYFPNGTTQFSGYPIQLINTSYVFVPMDFILLNKKSYTVSDITVCTITGMADLMSYIVSVSKNANGILIELSNDITNYLNKLCTVRISIP